MSKVSVKRERGSAKRERRKVATHLLIPSQTAASPPCPSASSRPVCVSKQVSVKRDLEIDLLRSKRDLLDIGIPRPTRALCYCLA